MSKHRISKEDLNTLFVEGNLTRNQLYYALCPLLKAASDSSDAMIRALMNEFLDDPLHYLHTELLVIVECERAVGKKDILCELLINRRFDIDERKTVVPKNMPFEDDIQNESIKSVVNTINQFLNKEFEKGISSSFEFSLSLKTTTRKFPFINCRLSVENQETVERSVLKDLLTIKYLPNPNKSGSLKRSTSMTNLETSTPKNPIDFYTFTIQDDTDDTKKRRKRY